MMPPTDGAEVWSSHWNAAQTTLRVYGHSGQYIDVSAATHAHELLGVAHQICSSDGAITFVAAIDWAMPRHIPAIVEPQRLPAMCGGALLNFLAQTAQHAGVPALRYVGAYPTAALFASLLPCFATAASEAEFTADGWQRALQGVAVEVPIDFSPRPFVRRWLTPRVATQTRSAIEAVFVDGVGYTTSGDVRRLVATAHGFAAQVWFGEVPWATVASLSAQGELITGPLLLPAIEPTVAAQIMGRELPPPLRVALAEWLSDDAPAGLAPLYAKVASETRMQWGYADTHAARLRGDAIELHAAIWQVVAPQGAAALVQAMAAAIAPLVTLLVQRALLAAMR